MKILPRRFFDAEAGENNGGGNPSETETALHEEEIVGGEPKAPEVKQKEIAAPIISDEDLKSYGFDSAEELKSFLRKQKEENISPEEKKKQEDLEKANFLKFSTEKDLLNVDEYNRYESLKAKADRDLVFEDYLSTYKEEHPEITDENELKEAAEEDFGFEYKLNSSNEATKKRAEAKLARDAKELRSPFESKVVSAQEKYKAETSEYKAIKEAYPKFEKFVDSVIEKNAPDKKVVTKIKIGEEELDIDIDLTKEDKEAIAKAFKTPKTFQLFTNGKPEAIQESLDNKIEGWILKNKKDAIIARAVEIAQGIGTKEGSTVGATNPFALKQGAAVEKTGEKSLEENNIEMANRSQKYRNNR